QTLATSDTPFGKVIRPLAPYRRTVEAHLLWHPLPEGWERGVASPAPTPADCARTGLMASDDATTACTAADDAPVTARRLLDVPQALFEQRALVYSDHHVALAEVHEVYQRGLLDLLRSPGPRELPTWLQSLVARIGAAPVTSPPSSIERATYHGAVVYY